MSLHVSTRRILGLIARGFCMGAADVVPGVSGGTMAFILGIYDELIDSIRTFGQRPFWHAALRLQVGKLLTIVHWKFLGSVGFGIVLAVLSLSHSIALLLGTKPLLIWSFFFGLVLASVHVVSRRIQRWTLVLFGTVVVGALLGYLGVGLVPVETPTTPLFLFFSGAIAICAMILPGISGAYLLLVLGKYEFILNAVNTGDLVTIGLVGSGAVVGIVLFSQFLSWMLHHHHDPMVAFLTGLMIGSLRKVWPWKLDGGTLQDTNVLPLITQNGSVNSDLLLGIGWMLVGFLLVLLLEWIASRSPHSS